MLAIRNDEELNKLLHDVHITSGGVIPNIHQNLVATGKEEDSKEQSTAASQTY